MKIFIRALWSDDRRPPWVTIDQREALRKHLNDHGFYVLTGAGDSLEVYVVKEIDSWDIKILKKTLDKIEKTWYTLLRRK